MLPKIPWKRTRNSVSPAIAGRHRRCNGDTAAGVYSLLVPPSFLPLHSSAEIMSCPSENQVAVDQSKFWDSNGVHWTPHRIGWAIAGGCTVLVKHCYWHPANLNKLILCTDNHNIPVFCPLPLQVRCNFLHASHKLIESLFLETIQIQLNSAKCTLCTLLCPLIHTMPFDSQWSCSHFTFPGLVHLIRRRVPAAQV